MMINLKIIHASTRVGRVGIAVSNWIYNEAKKDADFQTELIDLKELNLPFFDEPNHPVLKKYTKEHTKNWSKKVEEADVFIVVTCEYNHGIPAPLKNAFDFLHSEWRYKPIALVGYGGVSGGTRALQQVKQIVAAFKMIPFEGLQLPFFQKQVEEGVFQPTERNGKALQGMFQELQSLGENAKLLRKEKNNL